MAVVKESGSMVGSGECGAIADDFAGRCCGTCPATGVSVRSTDNAVAAAVALGLAGAASGLSSSHARTAGPRLVHDTSEATIGDVVSGCEFAVFAGTGVVTSAGAGVVPAAGAGVVATAGATAGGRTGVV